MSCACIIVCSGAIPCPAWKITYNLHYNFFRIHEALLRQLLPLINDIKEGLTFVKNEMNSTVKHLNESVRYLNVTMSSLNQSVSGVNTRNESFE